MRDRLLFLILGAFFLLACSIFSSAGSNLVPVLPTATSRPALPPTPSQGAVTKRFDEALSDLRFGQSGSGCDVLAADLTGQRVTGTLTIFPNAGQNQLRAVTNDSQYLGNAALLNSTCQPTGQRYALTANLGADYSATLGKTGNERCIQQSQLVLTSFTLQGLPGPLNALVQSYIQSNVEKLVTPYIDQTIMRQLNGGNLPASGARCP